jgi:YHS domain-containing protein
MTISPDEKRSSTYQGKTYYFCSDDDLEKFKKNPEKYVPDEQQRY